MATLLLDLDADSLGATGSAVSTWTDSVGSRAFTQATAALQPAVVAGPNSHKAVKFDGDSLTNLTSGAAAQAAITIVMVMRLDAIAASARCGVINGTGTASANDYDTPSGNWGLSNPASTGDTAFQSLVLSGAPANGVDSTIKTISNPLGTFVVITAALGTDGVANKVYSNGTVDGVSTGAFDNADMTLQRLILGMRGFASGPGDYGRFTLSRLRIHSGRMTTSERATEHSAMSDRYAITVSDYVAPADTQAPTVPASVTAAAQNGSITVSWAASTDNVGVTSYRVRRNGVDLVTAVTSTSYTDTSVVAGTSYTYTVSAVDAAGNRTAESAASASVTALAAGRKRQRWTGAALVALRRQRWNGTALVTQTLTQPAVSAQAPVVPSGTSTPARKQLNSGAAPENRVTWETAVNSDGKAQVAWIGSFPDVRARTSRLETGVAAQAQDAYQAQIVDTTTSTVVADSGVVTGTAEKWVAASFAPVAGRRYIGQARVRSADQQWSSYATTRFVAPSGRVLYLEDYGAVGDGVTLSGTRYSAGTYTGPIRNALKAAQPGDVVRSKAPGTTLTGITASGTTLSATTAVFTQAMAGKKIIVYGAGTTDTSSNSWAHRTTVSSVASDLKSLTLASAVLTNGADLKIIVNYAEYLTNHIDCDNGMGSPGNGGGWTLDGTGCVFTSDEFANNSSTGVAGFRSTIPDVSFVNVHYWQKAQTTRGSGKAGNTGPFFLDGDPVNNPSSNRIIGCYAERSIDAGFLIFGAKSTDIHVVDCVADHTNADGFHVTGAASYVQFIRCDNAWIGDDGVANIGYRSDGDGSRPHHITWERPRIFGQDWGRGVSQGGAYEVLVTDLYIERGAGASFILGSDGDMANTAGVQIRRFTIVSPNLRRGQKPTYSQGSSTGSTIPDEPWLKLLNSSSATAQRDILMEDGLVTDGRFIQIISYGNGPFQDGTITLRGITMAGSTNAGTSWLDQGTYSGHIDLRGIAVPSGSTAFTTAPANANS